MIVPVTLSLGIIAAVFWHGQLDESYKLKSLVRLIATIFIALVIGALTLGAWGCLAYALTAIVSAAIAFKWGPEIGWNKHVLRTQAIKGAWLTASFFPFGLLYAALRPVAYWIGYTRLTKYQDEVARLLSGVFLAITCMAVYAFAGHQLLAERLGALGFISKPSFFVPITRV